MDNLKTKEEEKKELTEQILNLKDMRRGSVTEQYYEVKHKDGTVIRQGPYFLYSYKEKGKTIWLEDHSWFAPMRPPRTRRSRSWC